LAENKNITPSDFISSEPAAPENGYGIISQNMESHNEYGFNVHYAQQQLLESIEIFYSRGKVYSKVILVNPKITAFKHDTLNYEGVSNAMELTFTIEYENVIYGNNNFELTVGNNPRNENDIRLRPKPTMPTQSPGIIDPIVDRRNLSLDTSGAIPTNDVDSNSLQGGITDLASSIFGNEFGGAIAGTINNQITNVESQLGNIVGNIGNDVANSVIRGIQTGDFSLQPNPIESARSVVRNAGRNILAGAEQQATDFVIGAVSDGVNAGVNAIIDSFNNSGQSGSSDPGDP
jgi:hypothetical protein